MADDPKQGNGTAKGVIAVTVLAALAGIFGMIVRPMGQEIASVRSDLLLIQDKMARDDRRETEDYGKFSRSDERFRSLIERFDTHEITSGHPGASRELGILEQRFARVDEGFIHLREKLEGIVKTLDTLDITLQREMRLLDSTGETRLHGLDQRIQGEMKGLDDKLQNEIKALREYLELKIETQGRGQESHTGRIE